jgi:Zn-dependent M28 family amino/carboxypeptidase
MLEMARLWRDRGYRPARSVLFAAWGAQELEEAGSLYFVKHPTLPLTQTVAMLQLEAVGGGHGFRLQALGDRHREAVLRFTMETAANQLEGRLKLPLNLSYPSDQESFQNLGIPALLIRWEKAEEQNLPAEHDDELDPFRIGLTGRTSTLAVMMLAQ